MYTKQVNLKKRGEMIAFLKNHFRYNTMNSWNRSTSYANNIKLHNVDKPDDVDSNAWWEMLMEALLSPVSGWVKVRLIMTS